MRRGKGWEAKDRGQCEGECASAFRSFVRTYVRSRYDSITRGGESATRRNAPNAPPRSTEVSFHRRRRVHVSASIARGTRTVWRTNNTHRCTQSPSCRRRSRASVPPQIRVPSPCGNVFGGYLGRADERSARFAAVAHLEPRRVGRRHAGGLVRVASPRAVVTRRRAMLARSRLPREEGVRRLLLLEGDLTRGVVVLPRGRRVRGRRAAPRRGGGDGDDEERENGDGDDDGDAPGPGHASLAPVCGGGRSRLVAFALCEQSRRPFREFRNGCESTVCDSPIFVTRADPRGKNCGRINGSSSRPRPAAPQSKERRASPSPRFDERARARTRARRPIPRDTLDAPPRVRRRRHDRPHGGKNPQRRASEPRGAQEMRQADDPETPRGP